MKTKKGQAAALLDSTGIDWIVEQITNGQMLTHIAADVGVSMHSLVTWLGADAERSARAREARRLSAAAYEELAEEGLRGANDPFGLAKAKELAHHYRWKASKLDPRGFGEKLALGGAEDLPPLKTMTDEQLEKRIAALRDKIDGNAK